MEQSIELDCAPGGTRPGDLIGSVIEDLGLEAKEPISKFFGNWKWDYSEVPAERWAEIKPTLKERVTRLYHSGLIRFGSW
jgi:hypothetical protein